MPFFTNRGITPLPVTTGTTWDATTDGDILATGSGGTLSGGNLIYTVTAPTKSSIFVNAGYSSGKRYLECTWAGSGIQNSTNGNGNFIALFRRSSYTWNTVGVFQALGDTAWSIQNTPTGVASTAINATPMVLGFAVDFTASRVWAGSNASGSLSWNQDNLAAQDPAAGIGGADFSAANNGTAYFFGIMDYGGAVGDSITLNTGPSFFYGLPSGYSGW